MRIQGLHHLAMRCRDSEETRKFYEDFLGLPFVGVLEINESRSGRKTKTLHSFYRMADGSHLAFFEAPDMQFEFKDQHDYDLHTALEVDQQTMHAYLKKGQDVGMETRGISDHGFIESIYFRDPNGYVVELCCRKPGHEAAMDPKKNGARVILDKWQAAKETLSTDNSIGPE